MPLVTLAELVLAATLGLAAAWKQRSRLNLAIGVALFALGTLLLLVQHTAMQWHPSLADAGAWLLIVIFVVELYGAPGVLTRSVPLLRRRAEWRFDRDLHALLDRFYALTAAYPIDGDAETRSRWGAQAARDLPKLATSIRKLRAPTDAWAGLRDDYAAAIEAQARYIEGWTSDPVSDRATLESRMTDLAARRLRLRAEYEDRPPSTQGD